MNSQAFTRPETPIRWGLAILLMAGMSLVAMPVNAQGTTYRLDTMVDQTPPPMTEFSDPAISKAVAPRYAAVGEMVIWMIDVWNPGEYPTDNIVFVRDFIPDMFDIVDITATRGAVTVEGQEVHVAIGTLQPGEHVAVTIRTVANALAASGEVCNTASADWNFTFTDTACVALYPGELPETGAGTPAPMFVGAAAVLVGGITLLGLALTHRRRV